MGEVKIKHKRTRVNTINKQLLDTVTGELTELKNETLYISKATSQVTVDYKNYVYLDTNRLGILLENGIRQVDLGLLITLSRKIQNRFCVCLKDDEVPHTTKTIAELIGETPQGVKAKLNRLEKQGVIAYTKSIGNSGWGKVYIINPHIIKKGINLSKTVCELFDDITAPDLVATTKEAFSTS
ncbi:hypothetical protein [Winogradskyella vincentii]|uniref:Winged helix-turn-helix DNA-binding n=1 Tax=Winogradskyella vincentii TaxID=2877122 RepID=A0ABS7XZ52_9FLAO|nr:hypothetical protein [Winogradskyella vincentii]MCA0152914.1 hypothetical protein [Winogradskyella vincentii]